MLASCHLHGAQHVVDAAQFGRLSVNSGLPSRIVDFREDEEATLVALHRIGEAVGGILGQLCRTLAQGRAFQGAAETLVGHGSALRVELLESGDFAIGILDKLEALHEPRIAVGLGIAYGKGALVADDVFRVEHIEHGEIACAVGGQGLRDGRWSIGSVGQRGVFAQLLRQILDHGAKLAQLGIDVAFEQVVVASQFGSVIATDGFVVIGGVVGRHALEVGHAIMRVGIGQNHLVGRRLLDKLAFVLCWVGKVRIVEVALVLSPHIAEAYNAQTEAEHPSANGLEARIKQNHRSANEDDKQGAQGRSAENVVAGRSDGSAEFVNAHSELLAIGRDGLFNEFFVGIGNATSCKARSQPEKQADARGEAERNEESRTCLDVRGKEVAPTQYLGQRHHGQQRNGELCHHQGRGDGAEFIVQWQMVDEEVCHRRNIVAPCKEKGDDGGGQQTPFQRTANDEEAQQEEEEHEGTDIDGTHGHGLATPIRRCDGRIVRCAHAKGRIHSAERGLRQFVVLNGRHGQHTLLRAAALEVGNQQGEGFVHAVAPLCDIVVVEASAGGLLRSLLALSRSGGELGRSAHGRLGIVVGMVEVGHIGQ